MDIKSTYTTEQLDIMEGHPVDLSAWAYIWRADLKVQEKPEAYFIPRRLNRVDRIYRTALPQMGDEIKSICYNNQPDLLTPLPPSPAGELLTGLLWVGGITQYQIELRWLMEKAVPSPDSVEVRIYPTAWGWFGWTVDKILKKPEVSADGRVWTYTPQSGQKMDFAYNQQADAATEMVAVFSEDISAIPEIRVTGSSLGFWKRMDIQIEHGLANCPSCSDSGIRIETHMALSGPLSVVEGGRNTLRVPVLYSPVSRYGLDSRITVFTGTSGVTVLIRELERGPVYIPEHGIFLSAADSGISASEFIKDLESGGKKDIIQLTREHAEASSWDEVLEKVRLWRCPDGTPVPPFPPASEPVMKAEVPDGRWTGMYRAAVDQLRGRHMWGTLAYEVGRVSYEMELVGLNKEADKIYDYFLASPGVKSDGDYTDPKGSLEWATSMRHDMGYSHEGTHCSTGRLLFSMAQRYFLTGDTEWFLQRKERLQQAADWIINERRAYMAHIPNRDKLHVAGLMPPCMLGDYALPSCDWHWYYADNAFSLQGLRRFADVLAHLGDENAGYYADEAEAFRSDLRSAVEREAVYAPVRQGRDGMYRIFIPRMAYAGGLLHYGQETNIPNYDFGISDLFTGALPLAEPYSVLEADDRRIFGIINAMEEFGTSPAAVEKRRKAMEEKGLSSGDAWFWHSFATLPKASHNANIYLRQDDIPNFLRFFFNTAITMVGANGKLWEHAHPDIYTDCEDPDNGTSGWFVENFRNMLVTEEDTELWLAKATPRAWLEHGKRISVSGAPSCFGTVEYEILSDTDNGKINAELHIPRRFAPSAVRLRLRHPNALPVRKVEVDGKPWADFDAGKEIITLKNLSGEVKITALY